MSESDLGLFIMLGGMALFLACWAIYFAIQDYKDVRKKNKYLGFACLWLLSYQERRIPCFTNDAS